MQHGGEGEGRKAPAGEWNGSATAVEWMQTCGGVVDEGQDRVVWRWRGE